MHWLRKIFWRWEVLTKKDALEDDLDRELKSHLESEIRENIRLGMSPGKARRRALLDFGGVERVKENVRDVRGARPLDDFLQDLRQAFRGARKRPVFAWTAILTLALGIGASTAMFTVVKKVLLNPLPYDDPQELVMLWQEMWARDVMAWTASPPEWWDYREMEAFEEVAAVRPISLTLTGDGQPEQVAVAIVSHNFFAVLTGSIALGRPFVEDDVNRLLVEPDAGTERPTLSVVIGHGLWQRRFGADPDIIGKTVQIGVTGATVVGVLSSDFDLLLPAATHIPRNTEIFAASPFPGTSPRRNVGLRLVGRLADGVTLDQAQAEMDAHWSRMREEYQLYTDTDHHGRVVPLQADLVREVRPMILILFGSVVLVLLIACANVSSLLLVRANRRSGEMGIRAALGGSRGRLIRQMLAEGILLAGIGLALGLLMAKGSISVLVAVQPVELPRGETIALDGGTLLFSFLSTVVAVFLFALFPAIQGSRTDLARTLQGRRTGGGSIGKGQIRSGLVVAEVALSLVLLIGAGLMVRSSISIAQVDPGFDPGNLLTFQASPSASSVRGVDARVSFVQELSDRFGAIPGVTSVSAAGAVPFSLSRWAIGRAGPEEALVDESLNQQAKYTYVFPDYFETMDIRLLEGRFFNPEEFRESIPVVVVDELLARALWPGQSAVGKTLVTRPGQSDPTPMEIVGVVEHQLTESLREPGEDLFYYPYAYHAAWVNPGGLTWTLRTAVSPESIVPLIRRELEVVAPDAPLTHVRTMESYMAEARAPTRFALSLIAFFALSSLALAVVGLYGVLASSVQQRTSEIGIRVAFGAEPGGILTLVLGKGMRMVGLGIVVGTLAALGLTRFMSGILVGTPPNHPPTFAGVGLLFLGVSALACYVPAWRATKVDPVRAIQAE